MPKEDTFVNKPKFIIILGILIVAICTGGYFILHCLPISLEHVMRKLDSYLTVNYSYISTNKSNIPNIEGIKTVTYHFKDTEGLEFCVVTFPRFGDYDTSQPGYPKCNYLTEYYVAHKDLLENALQCGVPITWRNTGSTSTFSLEIDSRADLEHIAPALEVALNMFDPLISSDYSLTQIEKFEFSIPKISVCIGDEKRVFSVFDFRLAKNQSSWTQQEILDKLYRDYNENNIN